VVRLETQYWALVELPKQDKQEPVPAYVLRACATLEKTQKPGEGVKTSAKLAEEDEKRRERLERLESKLPFVGVSDISDGESNQWKWASGPSAATALAAHPFLIVSQKEAKNRFAADGPLLPAK